MRILLIWVLPIAAFVGFCWWYTNTLGPLTPAEIAAYTEKFAQRDQTPARLEQIKRFMEEDDGGEFLMINLIEMRSGDAAAKAEEAMAKYRDFILPEILWRASHPVLVGATVSQAIDLQGLEGAERWSQVALVRYRSRRDLMEIGSHPDFVASHAFKLEAMSKTIAVPFAPPFVNVADMRVFLGLVFFFVMTVLHFFFGRSRGSAVADEGDFSGAVAAAARARASVSPPADPVAEAPAPPPAPPAPAPEPSAPETGSVLDESSEEGKGEEEEKKDS